MKTGFTCAVVMLLCACSGGESASEGHVWKEQTDMIDNARDVEDLLDAADKQQRQRIEELTQ